VNRAALGRCLKLVYDQRCKGVRHSVYEVSKDGYETVRRERESVVSRPFAWLSELEPAFVRQFGVLRYDESFDQTPLILHGHRYDSGLGTHAISEIRFDLDQAYSSFESDIGLDDSKMGGVGTAVFQVWVDDRKVYESKTMRAGDSPESIRMDITGATTLKLIVTDAGDGSQDDNADWAGARLIKKQ
jgi:beta-galactosidase